MENLQVTAMQDYFIGFVLNAEQNLNHVKTLKGNLYIGRKRRIKADGETPSGIMRGRDVSSNPKSKYTDEDVPAAGRFNSCTAHQGESLNTAAGS